VVSVEQRPSGVSAYVGSVDGAVVVGASVEAGAAEVVVDSEVDDDRGD
jgi:copper chaperone CopZ